MKCDWCDDDQHIKSYNDVLVHDVRLLMSARAARAYMNERMRGLLRTAAAGCYCCLPVWRPATSDRSQTARQTGRRTRQNKASERKSD